MKKLEKMKAEYEASMNLYEPSAEISESMNSISLDQGIGNKMNEEEKLK